VNSTRSDSVVELEQRLASAFDQIHQERMRGLPILHPGLRVAVVGGRRWQGDWLGILLTPWCMNLLLIPGPDAVQQPGPIGSTSCIDLPAGRFELIASEEAGVGRFAACSLFSPMQDFADQSSALGTAELIMTELFDPQGPAARQRPELSAQSLAKPPVHQQQLEPRPSISRRDLLRGRLRP
jgi:[NiFe] hydrogenase assembly HybE family chaperone